MPQIKFDITDEQLDCIVQAYGYKEKIYNLNLDTTRPVSADNPLMIGNPENKAIFLARKLDKILYKRIAKGKKIIAERSLYGGLDVQVTF